LSGVKSRISASAESTLGGGGGLAARDLAHLGLEIVHALNLHRSVLSSSLAKTADASNATQ
jgi:hypothetical protein